MLRIVAAAAGDRLSEVRILFEEYAASLGIDLDFQNFSAELRHLFQEIAPYRYNPVEGTAFMELLLTSPSRCNPSVSPILCVRSL